MSDNCDVSSSSDEPDAVELPTYSKKRKLKHAGNWSYHVFNSIWKLVESGYDVFALPDKCAIAVVLCGPKDTPFECGKWSVQVDFPGEYPIKAPVLKFLNRICHPNVSNSGLICLDLLDCKWDEIYDLKMIFEYILPQIFTKAHFKEALSAKVDAEKFDEMYDVYVHEVKSRYLSQKSGYRVVLGNANIITERAQVGDIMEKISERINKKSRNS